MTARVSPSFLAGRPRSLLMVLGALACARDPGDLFTPIGPSGPTGAAGAPPMAPTTVATGEPALPGAVSAPGAGESVPAGPLPVDPAAATPAAGAPTAAGEVEPAVADNPARLCPAIVQPLLLDFAQANGGSEQALFGDFSQLLSGGTFVYPPGVPLDAAGSNTAASGANAGATGEGAPGEAPSLTPPDDALANADAGSATAPPPADLPPPPPPLAPALPTAPATRGLASDVTAGDWHITGRVVEPAGFGLFFNCQQLDATRFAGVGFRLQGRVGLGGVVSLRVRTAGNEVAREWFIETGNGAPATFGRCFPATSQYDGTCEPSSAEVPVTPEGSDVLVRFEQLGGGRPEDGANPAEIVQIEWALPRPEASDAGVVASYDVDLHVDDIRFVER